MNRRISILRPANQFSSGSILGWRIAQFVVWLIGITLLILLLFYPSTGILLFWNVLIPVAPALFVLAAGVWRNVCPLATTNLLPRHFNLSRQKKLSASQSGQLNLAAVIILYAVVPLRHAVFNTNGPATAMLIIGLAVTGIILGFFYEWKSAWCSGLCPIHPVEKLYGGNTIITLPNAHCTQCQNCVVPCPDSTPNISPAASQKTNFHEISGLLIIGGLPGFIWGWFHVPDEAGLNSWRSFFSVYQLPFLGFIITMAIYVLLINVLFKSYKNIIIRIFAATGVSCYYWYRIPSLLGFGDFADDGMLVNLRNVLPSYTIIIITIITSLLFFYLMVLRKKNNNSWVIRPVFAKKLVS